MKLKCFSLIYIFTRPRRREMCYLALSILVIQFSGQNMHIYSKLITVDFYNIKKEIQNITHTTATGARNIDKLY